MQYADASKSW